MGARSARLMRVSACTWEDLEVFAEWRGRVRDAGCAEETGENLERMRVRCRYRQQGLPRFHGATMGHRWFARLVLGIALAATATTVRAQDGHGPHGAGGLESVPHDDGSLVPPWGRHLEAHHPAQELMAAEEETHGAPLPRVWFHGEYLLWFIGDDRAPPLLTRGLATSPRPGALDQPFTKVLDGGGVDFKERHGGRFGIGTWLAPEFGWSVEADYLFLSGRDVGVARQSAGTPVLARPFFDVLSGRQDSSLVSYPGLLTGGIEISNSSRLQGAEANLLKNLRHSDKLRVECLAGLRWLHLDEELIVQERSDVIDPTAPLFGTRFSVADEFEVDNHFFGGQVGLREELTWKRFRLRLVQKVALGVTRQTVAIRGRTVIDDGTPRVFDSGLLALASNRGRHTQSRFTVVPEIGASLGLAITEKVTFFAGYSFIYWSDVARPGAHVDRALNPNLIPTSATFGALGGPRRPAFRFDPDDWCAHGVNVGLEWKF